jgi:hypothetical protein
MNASPDLYGINDDELADELRNIVASLTIKLQGPVTVTAGMRRCPLGGPDHPVIVVRAADGQHLLALLDSRAAP